MILVTLKNQLRYAAIAALTFVVPLADFSSVYAAGVLTSRRVAISTSEASALSNQTISFTIPGVQNVGSMKFEYCENTPFVNTPCVAPSGLDVSTATLVNQTGDTGFTISPSASQNEIVITRTAVATSGTPVSYQFNGIRNPDTTPKTVFIRMSTYASTDATGSTIDEGTVAFSTAKQLSVNGYVPPYLTFCVGISVTLNCSSAQGYQLDFGELSSTATRAQTSEYAGASNDVTGFATSVYGNTMTSGNTIINSLSSPQESQVGVGQFGMNVRANSQPGVGAEPQGPGTSVASAPYGTPNQFYFGNQIISASPITTDFNKFTVSYIVNIPPAQLPGLYSTTITYVASASF
jgi:hypothetical protein